MDKKNVKPKNKFNPSDLIFGKIPPQAVDLEKAILGIMLVDSKSIKIVKETLEPIDFYLNSNTIICQSLFELSEDSNPDYLLVAQNIISKGLMDEVGGVYYIAKLGDTVSSSTNIKNYCLIVKQKAVQRRLIEFGGHILSSVYEDTDDVFDTIIQAEKKLKGISNELQGMQQTSLASIGMNVITEFDEKVYKAKNNIKDENAIFTGFKTWDALNGTMFPGLYIVAGRPGMGKGVHMTECICRMGKVYDIGIINGEMTDEQLMKRIGCNLMGIDNFLFKKDASLVTELEQEKLHEAMNEALNLKLHIENTRNIHKISNKIKLWVENYNVKCVFADFLTLFKVPPELEKYYTKTQQVDYILDIFTQLCKDLKIPIVLYVQMNREILGRHGIKEPNLADLKASGSIEELAYQVSFLHRPAYYDDKATTDENGEDIKGLLYQIIAKHRDGELGKLKFRVKLECSQISDWDSNSFFTAKSDLPF